MRSFTSYLHRAMRPEWKDYYLDYLSLKNLLEKFAERRGHLSTNTKIETIERFYPEAEESNASEFKKSKSRFGDFNLMSSSDESEKVTSESSCGWQMLLSFLRDDDLLCS